jgi:hypothetical protein
MEWMANPVLSPEGKYLTFRAQTWISTCGYLRISDEETTSAGVAALRWMVKFGP